MSPYVSSSGLSPDNREAKVQRAKVCLNCTEPSVARSSCWSLPVGRYLSDRRCKGSVWFSRGELRAIWPKSRRRLLVTRWDSVNNQWYFWLPHLTHGEYTLSSRSCVVPMCQMHRGETAGTLWWPKSRTHTSKLAQCMSDRGVTWFPAWFLTYRSSSLTYSCTTKLCQSDTGLPLCCHQRSRSCIPDRQMHRLLQHVHLPPGLLS